MNNNENSNTSYVADEKTGKYSELSYEVLAVNGRHTLVRIRLVTGRPHQIRVQFSSRGLPLVHDQRYNPHPGKGQIALWAYRLSFPHPVKQETVEVTSLPPSAEPWKEFEVSDL